MVKNDKKGFVESLTDFMSDPSGLSQEEIVNGLTEQGVDVVQFQKRVAEIVRKGSENRRLAWRKAAKTRHAEIEMLFRGKQKPSVSGSMELQQKIKEMAQVNYGTKAATLVEAYFRKKETVTEDDLATLLEDLEQLDLLEKKGEEED